MRGRPALIERGVPVVFVTVANLLDEFRASYGLSPCADNARLTEQGVFERYAKCSGLLILDELGGERIQTDERGNWAREKLLRIVDWRVTHGLTSCATTNLTEAQLSNIYNARIVSRLKGSAKWIEMDCPDYRRRRLDADPFADVDTALDFDIAGVES